MSAIFHTTGNDTCHVILRGGSRSGPNYDAAHVAEACARLADKGRRPTLMVDCSHGNSLKDHRRQPAVVASVCEQVAAGSRQVFGVMIESHLVDGRQDLVAGERGRYGQSITDACLSIEDTEPLLEQLAARAAGPRAADVPAHDAELIPPVVRADVKSGPDLGRDGPRPRPPSPCYDPPPIRPPLSFPAFTEVCMRPQLHVLLFAIALLFPLSVSSVSAQTPTFNVEGVVTDEQQAVLPGVTVTMRNVATGLTRTATTDTSGRYVFSGLPPEGRYEIETELTGFASQIRNNLVFNAGQRAVINIQMKLSSLQETITVAGDSPIVQTTSAEVSTTIDRTQFETLPVKERNYMRLLTLDSNVVASRPGTNAVNVGGGEVWNFGTYVDGTNNHSKWLTLQRAPQLGSGGFALETVKEMQIITNQFSAEFGGHAAGVSSMITKSGTNIVSGSAFVMIRPGDWDAKPPLAPTKAPYNQQQFGGVLGGPMIKRQGVLLRQLRAPPRAQRSGAHLARGDRSRWSRLRPTSTRASSAPTSASPRSRRWACATTWCAGTRTTRAAG